MSSETLTVAVCQMQSVDDVEQNLIQIANLIEIATGSSQNLISVDNSELKPKVIFFPENCLYLRIIEGSEVPSFSLTDDIFKKLSELAQKHSVSLHLGSVPLRINNKVYNSSVFIDQLGAVKSTYQKIHLFDIQLKGQNAIRESDVFQYGEQPHVLTIADWKFGESICYDVRFSELYNYYAKREVDVLLIPSAFLVKTGEAHWEPLLRARAIESQSYVIASAQGGTHRGKTGASRETYGHTMVVSPWGRIEVLLQNSPSVEIIKLSKNKISEVRRQIPMKMHRRI